MSWIKPVTYETASPEVKAFLDEKGHEILNSSRKRPYQMQNLVVYETIEAGAGKMDDEVQRVVGKRYGDLLEYTISNEKHSRSALHTTNSVFWTRESTRMHLSMMRRIRQWLTSPRQLPMTMEISRKRYALPFLEISRKSRLQFLLEWRLQLLEIPFSKEFLT